MSARGVVKKPAKKAAAAPAVPSVASAAVVAAVGSVKKKKNKGGKKAAAAANGGAVAAVAAALPVVEEAKTVKIKDVRAPKAAAAAPATTSGDDKKKMTKAQKKQAAEDEEDAALIAAGPPPGHDDDSSDGEGDEDEEDWLKLTNDGETKKPKRKLEDDIDEDDGDLMKATKKKPRTGDSKDDGDDSASDEEDAKEINVQFDIFDPVPEDFHTVKIMCKQYGETEEFDLSGFTDLIVEQTEVGSMMKADTEDSKTGSPVGFITVINLHQHQDKPCIQQLKALILDKCPESNRASLKKMMEHATKPMGLIVHERLANVPTELSGPLHDALRRDLEWVATSDEAPAETKAHFTFGSYLMFERVFKMGGRLEKTQPAAAAAGKGGKKDKSTPGKPDMTFFRYLEDEFYLESADPKSVFSFPAREAATNSEMDRTPQLRVVMVLTPAQLATALEQVTNAANAEIKPVVPGVASTPRSSAAAAPAVASSSSSSSSRR